MKKDIHPQYVETTVTCGCGNKFTTRSTKKGINVEYAIPKEGYMLWAMSGYITNNPSRPPERTTEGLSASRESHSPGPPRLRTGSAFASNVNDARSSPPESAGSVKSA